MSSSNNDDDEGDDDGGDNGGDDIELIDTPAASKTTLATKKATNTSSETVNNRDTLSKFIYIYVCQYSFLGDETKMFLDAKIDKLKRKLDQHYILSVFLDSKFPKAVWKIVTDYLLDWEAMFNLNEERLLCGLVFLEKKRSGAAHFVSFLNDEVFFRVSHVHRHTLVYLSCTISIGRKPLLFMCRTNQRRRKLRVSLLHCACAAARIRRLSTPHDRR